MKSRLAAVGLPFVAVLFLSEAVAQTPKPAAPPKPAAGLAPLNKEKSIFLDAARKTVIVESEVVLREGMLEMLLCKRHTKEHEAIVAFNGDAQILHAGLLAIGLEPGKPVRFTPDYVAPEGPQLRIEVVWKDEKGKEQRADARNWIRHSIHRYFGAPLEKLPDGVKLPDDGNLRYDAANKELSWYGPMSAAERDRFLALSTDAAFRRAVTSFFARTRSRKMEADWVFAGSGFITDESNGQKLYLAESGDVICVANFPSAMIDITAKSSAEGQENLTYEAWTEQIPPKGTSVRLEISPVPVAPASVPVKPAAPDLRSRPKS